MFPSRKTLVSGVVVALIGAAAVYLVKRAGKAAGVLPASAAPGTGPNFVPETNSGFEDVISV